MNDEGAVRDAVLGANAGDPDSGPRPYISYRGQVEPHWLDVNRHMNVSWYDRVFDIAESDLFEVFGIHDDYIRRTSYSFFRLEKSVRYERELMPDAKLEARSLVLWTDLKRVHHFHELWNIDQNYRAATVEGLSIHVDLRLRKAARIVEAAVADPLTRLAQEHARLPWPVGVARRDFRKRT
ncbi:MULTISPECIES: thioesterase family protein [Hyphomicrobiales]|jgi:acyl-CoA thioester hydrolase|uniref:thioesterase family protein n=1 Tax=Hyphomicrobiales TaxID=356 RepID=UPI00036ABF46|nr:MULTISPECIES: thioesterase family protein [Phyllobacteriaceae]MCX8570066.1 thioesterase family protein [Aminobacter sp. MET-1]